MNQEYQNNKLNAKDLINVGIFTAIYFALYFLIMMLGYIPVFTILLVNSMTFIYEIQDYNNDTIYVKCLKDNIYVNIFNREEK